MTKRYRGVPVELPKDTSVGFYCPALKRSVESCGYDLDIDGHKALCVGSVCARSDPDAVVAMTLGKPVR